MGLIQTGRVTGGEIKKNKDGEKKVLILQVEITEPDDVQSVQLMKQAGEDTNPPDGSTATILSIGEAFKIAVASDDGIEPSMGKGEKKIYSSSGGTIQAFIDLLADGNIEIDAGGGGNIKLIPDGIIELNGNADNAVRFIALQTAFNQLRTDLNNFITLYNVHTHGDPVPVTPPTTAASAAIPSVADILPAKVEEVKII